MKKRLFAVLATVALLSGCATSSGADQDIEDEDVARQEQQSEAFAHNAKDRVLFGFDKSNLTPEAIKILKVQLEFLKANPEKKILIEGHTDERGTREYNQALGYRRATAVKNYLVSHDIEESRIDIISYGMEKPAVAGANEAAWAQNRRAVTLVKD